MQVAHVNGIVLHYRSEGLPSAPALVFANSLGTDLRVWDDVVEKLAGEFRIIRYDKRGHGLSEAPPAPYSIEDHTHDLAALLEHLDVDQAIICGLSVGGMIAQMLATDHPELVRGLVLSDTAHKIGTAELWNSRIEAITAKGIEVIADGILERWFAADFRNRRAHELQGWRNMLTRTPVAGYVGTCAAIRDADLTARAEAITQPTLCLGGAQDGATPPELVDALTKLIRPARFHLIEDAGHLPCVERPDVVVDEMTRFFREEGLG